MECHPDPETDGQLGDLPSQYGVKQYNMGGRIILASF